MVFNYFKKIINFIFLLHFVVPPTISLDKFFVGMNFGHSFSEATLNKELVASKNTSNFGNSDIIAGIFLGYNNSLDETPLFVGFELGAQYHKHTLNSESTTVPPIAHYISSIKTNGSVTGLLKFGVTVKDLLFYTKGGLAWTNWSVNFSDKGYSRLKNSSKSYQKFAPCLGFGIDYILNNNWAMGIDYTHTNYPQLKICNYIGTFKTSPIIHTSSLRLIYSF